MKSGPDITDEELIEMIEADIAHQQAFRLRIGGWWWRIYWLLCFLPGCTGFALHLVTWLNRRYPEHPSD